jgi:hypothetical protein
LSVSDRDWFGIRAAAHRLDWDEVAERADDLGWPVVAKHARRARFDPTSIPVLVFALRLDRPDEPDPFKETSNGA